MLASSVVFVVTVGIVCAQTASYTPASNQQTSTASSQSNQQTTTTGSSNQQTTTTASSGGQTTTSAASGSQTTTGGSSTTNQTCVPSLPVGYAFDTPAQNGIWYQYMYGPAGPNLHDLVNCMELDRGVGWVYDSNDGAYMQATAAVCRFDAAPHNCWGGYVMQNTTCNGFCYGLTRLDPALGAPPGQSKHWFYKLYLDPNFFYLRAGCFDPDNFLDGSICKQPGMSVWTRKMPKDITPLEDAIIRDAIDDRFQFMCVTSKDMIYNTWIYDLPACDFPGRPQAYLEDQRWAEENLVGKCASKQGTSCAPASFY
ncbi:uncharacterized protein LOC129595190 [Paramacrobiotus metropolitanus]|uniref:uncharacterized protein LOC129595190 n=1 Tax=Paramacrobiotus metropolitanus TaxID=2943436 RepID=UPI0024459569|nr:uncharacterized protein LOC129595190 [Paramacrobiotus metropolitanus]